MVLRINQTYWEKIIDRIVSRNSTFGSEEVRAAFILALAELVGGSRFGTPQAQGTYSGLSSGGGLPSDS